jgi:hypothetical protein
MIFPRWRYHRTKPACIVYDAAEYDALGDGWADTPAAFEGEADVATAEAEPEPEQRKPTAKKTRKARS